MSLYEVLKMDWDITKKAIKSLGLNPGKEWEQVTVEELGIIADALEVGIADLF